MSNILETFDSINIDVAKRKYYNVNKVNAVLEELREKAVQLVEENERLKNELAQKNESSKQSEEMLRSLQELYRETLEKAHKRADAIVQDAEEESLRLQKDTEQKAEHAAKQVQECIGSIRAREEQNIAFLNKSLQQFLKELQRDDSPKTAVPAGLQETTPDASNESTPMPLVDEDEEQERESGEQLQDLERKISLLAREISALESGE